MSARPVQYSLTLLVQETRPLTTYIKPGQELKNDSKAGRTLDREPSKLPTGQEPGRACRCGAVQWQDEKDLDFDPFEARTHGVWPGLGLLPAYPSKTLAEIA